MRPFDARGASQRTASTLVAWWIATFSSACSEPLATATGTLGLDLVYGADDRRDVYATERELFRALALESAVALIAESSLERRSDGGFDVVAEALGDFANLCASEAFREQPTAALCSGVLVDESLVLTAAHCASSVATCADQRWVFGYAVRAEGESSIVVQDDDIYRCRSVPVSRRETSADGRRWDYALVELDRPVSRPRRPAKLATADVATGDTMTVIGYPNGLPAKVASAGVVLDDRSGCRDYFTLDSDTFDGNSGSGVFDERGEVAGVFTRGADDYEYRAEEGCFVVRRLESPPEPAHGEQAGHFAPAIAEWCASGAGGPLCSHVEAADSPIDSQSCSARLRAESPAGAGCTIGTKLGASSAWRCALSFAGSYVLLAMRRRSRRVLVRKNDDRRERSTLAT
ncbi:MAG TPA: serine protease [Polyangiaceae bacterium]